MTPDLDEMRILAIEARKNRPTVEGYRQMLTDEGSDATTIRLAMVRIEQMPETMRKRYYESIIGTASAQQRIKSFCLECVGYDRAEVALCTDKGCTLYGARPIYKQKEISTTPTTDESP